MYLVMLVGIIIMYNLFLTVMRYEPSLSMLPYRLTVAAFGIITYRAIDDFILTEVDTYELMKNNPVGYAVYLFGYAVIIAAALWGA